MAEAADSATERDSKEGAGEPQPCMPCHGSGQVISNLGGTPRRVTCPWCHGEGVRIAGADAQEYRLEQDGGRRP